MNYQFFTECFYIDEKSPSMLKWKIRPLRHFKTLRGMRTFNNQKSLTCAGNLFNSRFGLRWRISFHKEDSIVTQIPVSRIVWMIANQKDIPEGIIIDHIDGNSTNNHPKNLRLASLQGNARNKGTHKNNISGIPGVRFNKASKKWCAYITVNRRSIHLGLFEDRNKAISARKKAELKYFEGFHRV